MNAQHNMKLKMSAGMLCLFLFASIMPLREVTGQGECISYTSKWYTT